MLLLLSWQLWVSVATGREKETENLMPSCRKGMAVYFMYTFILLDIKHWWSYMCPYFLRYHVIQHLISTCCLSYGNERSCFSLYNQRFNYFFIFFPRRESVIRSMTRLRWLRQYRQNLTDQFFCRLQQLCCIIILRSVR